MELTKDMNLTEIKKTLYKEKPVAWQINDETKTIDNKSVKLITYKTECSIGTILFTVPTNDMGDKLFDNELPAQLLIRWINF